ncbi:hypothetical protein C7S18_13500 [Ahniella affigens]|uniref:Phytase-like domain-containing protein n=1 Tax=Ahniella affigens TaxID=2021234 RepID=A0A2P1PTG9_9GAMM|nr:hypothetical protein [Ahniella affigens]AVP98145.1 hypothetical protein C7S18_13500 [Ahniella affigens]
MTTWQRSLRVLVLLFWSSAAAGTFAAEPDQSVVGAPNLVGMLRDSAIAEVSGMTISQRHPNLLWAVNDSDHPAALEALDRHGGHLGTVDVLGAHNIDWEDLQSFQRHQVPHLLIADTGDNGGLRSEISIYVVVEPNPDDRTVPLSQHFRIRFGDGPHDVEAVFLDTNKDTLYLIGKRQRPAGLYAVPLNFEKPPKRRITARKVGTFATIPGATPEEIERLPRYARYFGQATGAVADPNGSFVVVLTYKDAFLFERHFGQSWLEALRQPPKPFGLPFMPQAEAIAFDPGMEEFLITTENLPAPILSVKLP